MILIKMKFVTSIDVKNEKKMTKNYTKTTLKLRRIDEYAHNIMHLL